MVLPSPLRITAVLLGLSAAGCAGRQLAPTIVSSAEEPSYALSYPEALDQAAARFASDKARAQALSSELPSRAAELKSGGEAELLLRVVGEADAAGRSQRYARAQEDVRAVREFWDDERGALAARAASAAEKQVSEAGCRELDTQGAIGHALRDGFDRQLERRMRAQNEAQRTLELHKARLPAPTLHAMQRLADELALSSQLVNVTLVEDVRELERLLAERRSVEDTFERAIDDERAIQTEPRRKSEQKASQERVIQVEKVRAAVAPSAERARAALGTHEAELKAARAAHQSALDKIKTQLEADVERERASAK